MLKVSSLNLNFDLETQQKQNRVTQPKQKFESSVINETENRTSKILQANRNNKIRNSKRKLEFIYSLQMKVQKGKLKIRQPIHQSIDQIEQIMLGSFITIHIWISKIDISLFMMKKMIET